MTTTPKPPARKPRHDLSRLAIFGGHIGFGERQRNQIDAHVVAFRLRDAVFGDTAPALQAEC